MTKQIDLWPYSESSGLISRELARSIRAWALTEMTEAQLNNYSQRQLMQMYIERGIVPTIEKVLGRRLPSDFELAKAVLDRGELFGIPLDPRASLEKSCPREEDRRAAIDYIADQPTPLEAREAAKRVLDGTWVRE